MIYGKKKTSNRRDEWMNLTCEFRKKGINPVSLNGGEGRGKEDYKI